MHLTHGVEPLVNRKHTWVCGYDGDSGDRGCLAAMSCTITVERPSDLLRDVNVTSPGTKDNRNSGSCRIPCTFSLVQGINIGFRPYAFGPVDGTGHVGSRVLEGVILHGSFRPVPCFQYRKPRKGGFSVNTSISPPCDGTLPFPPMRMCTNGPPRPRTPVLGGIK